MTNYTKEAEMALAAYMRAQRNFDGRTVSMDDDARFSLKDASELIRQARIDKQHILRDIERERGSQDALGQAREDVSLLPDREAQKIQSQWIKDAEASASRYCQSKNAGGTPRSFDPNDKDQVDIRLGVLSWLERQRARGHFPRKK